jgi:uncharacterized DUF497 family protein
MDILDLLARCVGFEWDTGNLTKNQQKHDVSPSECEQIFFNHPLVVAQDERHSDQEDRFFALGQTDAGRLLFVVFVVRKDIIRVISSRNMNRKERKVYESS